VVVLPDSGSRYVTKFYSDEWMKDNGFFDPTDRLGTVADLLGAASSGLHGQGGRQRQAGRRSDEATRDLAAAGGRAREQAIAMLHEWTCCKRCSTAATSSTSPSPP